MPMSKAEAKNGVVVATCTDPPMNYFCAEGTAEFAAPIEQWKSAEMRTADVELRERASELTLIHHGVRELATTTSQTLASIASEILCRAPVERRRLTVLELTGYM